MGGLSIWIPNCSKQRSGRIVAGCGGYGVARRVNQQTLIVRLDAPAILLAVSGESRHKLISCCAFKLDNHSLFVPKRGMGIPARPNI